MPDDRPHKAQKSDDTGKTVRLSTPLLGYHTIEFTAHALHRMKIRSVSEEDVLNAIRLSNREVPGPQPPNRKRISWYKSRSLRIDVVYEKAKDRLGIITVIPLPRSLRPRW